MNLYMLRHAIAVPRGTPGYRNDSQRPLTPDGIKKMQRIAKGIRALKLDLDLILSSPYLRARHTAEIAAKTLRAQKTLKFSDHLVCEGSAAKLVAELASRWRGHDNVMLVGHEPYLSELVSVLIAGEANASLLLKKGGLCKLSADALRYNRCATLEWLLTPRQLIALGRD